MAQIFDWKACLARFPRGKRNLQKEALRLLKVLKDGMLRARGHDADVLQLRGDTLESARQRAAVHKEQCIIRDTNGARFTNPRTGAKSASKTPPKDASLLADIELAAVIADTRVALDMLLTEKPDNVISIGTTPADPTGHA